MCGDVPLRTYSLTVIGGFRLDWKPTPWSKPTCFER